MKITSNNPYSEIGNIIVDYSYEHGFGDYVVTIKVDNHITTEFLEYEGNDNNFVWLNDWHEGEKDIELLGFIRLCEINIIANDDSFKDMTITRTTKGVIL